MMLPRQPVVLCRWRLRLYQGEALCLIVWYSDIEEATDIYSRRGAEINLVLLN